MIQHAAAPVGAPATVTAAAPVGQWVGGHPAYLGSSLAGQQFTTYSGQTLTAATTAQPQRPVPVVGGGTVQSSIVVPQAQPGAMPPAGGTAPAGQSGAVPPPMTPIIQTSSRGGAPVAAVPQQRIVSQPGGPGIVRTMAPPGGVMMGQQMMTREQMLEQRVRELEQLLGQKDAHIKELQGHLAKAGVKVPNGGGGITTAAAIAGAAAGQPKVRSPGRNGSSGFRKISGAKPNTRYAATDQDDPVDIRLEEWYNTTGSAVQFRRINKGFYRFGDTIAELNIVNHKLMARTEDGWNRGKWGPVEKFLMYYENIEREKAGLVPEA